MGSGGREMSEHHLWPDRQMNCLPDSSGADWFMCHRGTVGCPRIHDGLTPHCIECAAGGPCGWDHEPPVLEVTWEMYSAACRVGKK